MGLIIGDTGLMVGSRLVGGVRGERVNQIKKFMVDVHEPL